MTKTETTLLALTGPAKDRMTLKARTLWYYGTEVLIYETTARGVRINVEGVEYGTAAEAAVAITEARTAANSYPDDPAFWVGT